MDLKYYLYCFLQGHYTGCESYQKHFLELLLILQDKKKWDSSSITLHVLHNVKLRGILFSYLPVTQRYHHPCNRYHTLCRVIWFDFLCLTPLSTIFQLYHGDRFLWWKKPEYLERTTNHGQATGKLYHLRRIGDRLVWVVGNPTT